MNCTLYYRDGNGQLKQVNATDVESTEQARQMAEDLLVSEKTSSENTPRSSPILALVQGGKSSVGVSYA